MKLFVKVVGGARCLLEVTETTSILEVKQKIEAALHVPVLHQSLFHLGTLMSDKNIIGFYNKLPEGAKVYVVVNKPKALYDTIEKYLLKHYNKEQAKLIVDEFIIDFNNTVEDLSLDDLERIAVSFMSEE